MKNVNEPREAGETREGTVVPFDRSSESKESLISKRQTEELRSRWTGVQASFVDEPRKAVQEADQLISSAIKQIQEGFQDRRGTLEKQWSNGKDVSTEDLRLALQHYRAFFDRLLSL
jgi:hypothetical protein